MLPLKLLASYYIPHIKKYKWLLIFSFACYGVGLIGHAIVIPLLSKEIIDVITSVVMGESRAAVEGDLMRIVIAIAITILVYDTAFRIADFVTAYSQSNILRDLHNFAFKKLQNHSYKFFVGTFQGALVAKSKRFVHAFEDLHDNIIGNLWPITVKLLGIFIVLFYVAPIVATVFVLWSLIYLLVTIYLIQKKRKYDLKLAAADSRVTASLADAITNVLNIKMFASLGREIGYFGKVTSYEDKTRRAAWYFNCFIMLVQAVMWFILEITGLYITIKLWTNGSISAGTVVLIQMYFTVMLSDMWNLGRAINRLVRALSYESEMVEIFEKKPDVLDPINPIPCNIDKGRIVFDRAFFGYDEGISIFDDFNLTIEAGQKVGLIGSSGAGKTTITKLLQRFIDVLDGVVTIDGLNIAHLAQDELRAKIAYVPQDPVLFHRTLGENIAYGDPNANEEEIIEVSKRAHAHEFISRLPKGYDTLVGERGIKLSGGERQRVAVARAMLIKNAPILILDEATSSLDSLSEQFVQDSFSELMKDKTTIVIAHRLSTIKKMDRIIVLSHGKVIEEGTHRELLDRRGQYYDFWTHQSGGFIS